MEWTKKLLTGIPTREDKKLFQTKVDRQLSNEFKMVCLSLGKTQKDIIEDFMVDTINEFKSGRLLK